MSKTDDMKFADDFTDKGPCYLYGCMQCQTSFRSLGGEGAHMNRIHGEVHPVRRLMGSTQCSALLERVLHYGQAQGAFDPIHILSDKFGGTWFQRGDPTGAWVQH